MGLRSTSVRIILEPVLARRAGLSPSDVSADHGDARLGVLVADLPRGRHRKTRL